MSDVELDRLTRGLLIAAKRFSVPPDVLELLVSGDAMRNIPPGALQAALNDAAEAEREACAMLAELPPAHETILDLDTCEDIADLIRARKDQS